MQQTNPGMRRAEFALLLSLITASSPLSSAGNTMTPKWDDLIPGTFVATFVAPLEIMVRIMS